MLKQFTTKKLNMHVTHAINFLLIKIISRGTIFQFIGRQNIVAIHVTKYFARKVTSRGTIFQFMEIQDSLINVNIVKKHILAKAISRRMLGQFMIKKNMYVVHAINHFLIIVAFKGISKHHMRS